MRVMVKVASLHPVIPLSNKSQLFLQNIQRFFYGCWSQLRRGILYGRVHACIQNREHEYGDCDHHVHGGDGHDLQCGILRLQLFNDALLNGDDDHGRDDRDHDHVCANFIHGYLSEQKQPRSLKLLPNF